MEKEEIEELEKIEGSTSTTKSGRHINRPTYLNKYEVHSAYCLLNQMWRSCKLQRSRRN